MEAFAELFERFRFFVIRRGPSRHRQFANQFLCRKSTSY
jgi:hypothetical protein